LALAEPFFFPEGQWIPAGAYFPPHTQVGKRYSMDEAPGHFLWQEVTERLAELEIAASNAGLATVAAVEGARYGKSVSVTPRLGFCCRGSVCYFMWRWFSGRCAEMAPSPADMTIAATRLETTNDDGEGRWKIVESFAVGSLIFNERFVKNTRDSLMDWQSCKTCRPKCSSQEPESLFTR
jgi:hypothetical protein